MIVEMNLLELCLEEVRTLLVRRGKVRRGSSREVRQMTEEDLKHKLNRDQDDRRRGMPPPPQPHRWDQGRREDKRPSKDLASDPVSGMLCYNCNQVGHHKSQCTNPSFCYGCKQSGHISSKCPNAKQNKGLRLRFWYAWSIVL